MTVDPFYAFHIVTGALAILLYWATFAQSKGSAPHRRYGKWFLIALAIVMASVGGLFFLSGRPYSASEIIQFTYLALCVFMVASTAFLAIRWKRELPRFRGLWFKVTGIAAFVLALVVLAAGIATSNLMPVIFSGIGLLYGGAMMRFSFMRAPVHTNWPLIWHLNGMTFLFNAVHGTMLAVVWRWLVDPAAGPELNMITQIGTMLGALGLRLYFALRFDAPLRLTAPRRTLAAI